MTTSKSEALSATADLIIRAAQTEDDAIAVHRLFMVMGKEVAVASVNPVKTMHSILALVKGDTPGAILLAVRDDTLVGVMRIVQGDYWFSDELCLVERGWFVVPGERNNNVGPALLAEARALADMLQQTLYVTRMNPNKRRGSVLVFDPRTA